MRQRVSSLKGSNKGAIAMYWLIIVAVVVILLLIVVASKGGFASKQITSAVTKDKSCSSADIPVSIKGTGFSKDTAFFGVLVAPEKITIDEVRAGGTALRAISSQDYTWQVKLYDDFTGNLVASDGGSNTHLGGSVTTEDKFAINFFVPDNDCNGKIDNFEGVLDYQVTTDDDEVMSVTEKVSFTNGRLIRT